MSLLRDCTVGLLLFTVCTAYGQTLSGLSSDGAAKVVELDGQVSVLKDSTRWALSVGNVVQVKQTIVTGPNGYAKLAVSDGSTFEVFPNSEVIFRANPANWKDLLDVYLGRVKVYIEKLSGGQPNHNRVNTPTAVISVRGTVFDVLVEDDTMTLVSVDEGLVAVDHRHLPSGTKYVNPGESLHVYRDQPFAKQSSPARDRAIKQGLQAAAEAIYRAVYRTATPGVRSGGGSSGPSGPSVPGGGGGGAPLPGDTDTNPPPPPPPLE